MNLLISLYDYSGNQSEPYRKNGWEVWQIEIKRGIDILSWDFITPFEYLKSILPKNEKIRIGIIAPIPCTDYALSGARHFKAKDEDGRTAYSQKMAEATKKIINYFENIGGGG